jgi:hypothetical protein
MAIAAALVTELSLATQYANDAMSLISNVMLLRAIVGGKSPVVGLSLEGVLTKRSGIFDGTARGTSVPLRHWLREAASKRTTSAASIARSSRALPIESRSCRGFREMRDDLRARLGQLYQWNRADEARHGT